MGNSSQSVIILTSALTDGSFTLKSWKSFTTSNPALESAAMQALQGTKSSWAKHVLNAITHHQSPTFIKPVTKHNSTVVGATYHHGEHYVHYMVGPLSSVLRLTNSSENERENATQFARMQTTMGYVTYAVAKGLGQTNVDSLSHFKGASRLDLVGLVVLEPVLYPHALKKLADLKTGGKTLHYITEGDENLTSALATKSHLMKPSDLIITRGDDIPFGNPCVAKLSNNEYSDIITNGSYGHVYDTLS